jgi:hypothetical protein
LIREAIARLIDPNVGWLQVVEIEGLAGGCGETAGKVPPKCLEGRKRREGKEGKEYSVGFESFWSVYPNKKSKAAASKAFDKAMAVEGVTLGLLTSAVNEQKTWDQWRKDGGAFIPHPATWLNGGRWDDENPDTPPPRKSLPGGFIEV